MLVLHIELQVIVFEEDDVVSGNLPTALPRCKVLVGIMDYFLSPNQGRHSGFVLEVHLKVLAYVAAEVELDEGSVLEFRVHLDHALFLLVAYLGVEVAGL